MQIKDLFQKSIDRNIQGVIKVGQEDNIEQELDEYVVTKELQNQFARFFSAYQNSLNGATDDMGVWISGFFGSGKSHFLKIIADILENRVVNGKPAVDHFEGKIHDQITFNQMQEAAQSHTKVILFNIDAKAMSGDKSDDNVIVKVFLQVFNEMQGFSDKNPWIADLERHLVATSKYDEFKQAFQVIEKNHLSWEQGRDHYAFNKGDIRDALVKIGFMTEEDAQGFIEQLSAPYDMNVEGFAKLVNDYVEKTGYRVAFLVDEVGQFVGDSLQRMLNLQTVVEELGRVVKGKAWVVVTSQQAIGEVTNNVNGQDFSKIQGRFKTRIALSSANVDEVIQKRLLAKTDEVQHHLEGMYSANGASINNAIDFDHDDVQRQKYNSPKSFADNYPFVPYQFNLLQQVLTAIRTHGSDGKHLSEGERSMLSIFQESAQRMENKEIGALIPFSLFFEGLEQFLDHTHRIVIEHAREDEQVINPQKEQNPFAIQVLKTLFMVKYVPSFKATLNNIVTLMINNVDIDKIELTKKVQDALSKLIRQRVVEKNMDVYVFLTDTEQDINQEIDKQQVSDAEIINQLGDFLFDHKVISPKYSYPKLSGRYVFSLNEYVDDTPFGRISNTLSIRVISPLNLEKHDSDNTLLYSAGEPNTVMILLPDQDDYIDYIRRAAKIYKFLRLPGAPDARYRALTEARAVERNELLDQARQKAIDALYQAQIFVGGRLLDQVHDFDHRLDEALQNLVDDRYRNLNYIDAAKDEKDILQVLQTDELVTTAENSRAVDAVYDWLQREKEPHITLKRVLGRFHEIPFGYTEADVEWIIAELYTTSKIKLIHNGEVISRVSEAFNPKKFVELLTKKQYAEDIAIQIKPVVAQREIKQLRQVASQVFKKNSFSSDNPELIVSDLKNKVHSDLQNLQRYETKSQNYPGHDLIQKGIDLLKGLDEAQDSDQFFEFLGRHYDDLLDWREDFEDRGIADFYLNKVSQDIWASGLRKLEIYKHSKERIHNQELADTVSELDNELKSNRADRNIQKIKKLNDQFIVLYSQIFDDYLDKVQNKIENYRTQAKDKMARSGIGQVFAQSTFEPFSRQIDQVLEQAQNAKTLNDLLAQPDVAQRYYQVFQTRLTQAVDDIRAKAAQRAREDLEAASESKETGDDEVMPVLPVEPKIKKIDDVKASDLATSQIWNIENPEDIDRYVAELKQQLTEKLKNADAIDFHL